MQLRSSLLLATLGASLALPTTAHAQRGAANSAEQAAVLAVVKRLFDGMRAGDSAAVRSVFHPQAQLGSTSDRQGRPVFRVDSLDGFIRAIGTAHPQPWDERTYDEAVHIDGPLAAVWAEYSFYLGERRLHCGVDAFQLARGDGGWKIVSLIDTRRTEGCR